MTDQTPEQPPAEPPQEDRIDTLEKKVDQILGMLSGGQRPSPAEPAEAEPKSVSAAETRRAVQQLARADAAKKARLAERERTDARLKAVEDKISEKPPEEYSKITNFMRWRDKPKEKQA